MGLGQSATAFVAAAATAVGAETSRADVDMGPDLTATAITSTYNPSADDARGAAIVGAEERIDQRFAVAAEQPVQQEPGAGTLLRRRSERQQPASQPAPAEEAKPNSEGPKPQDTAQPATSPAAARQQPEPANATQPSTQPATTPQAELWKPLSQEQIEKLSPAEMAKIITDLEKRAHETATALRVTQDQSLMYQQVSQILAENKEAGSLAQVNALNQYFGAAQVAEADGLRQREAGIRETRKALSNELVDGVPILIVDTVAALNQSRKDLAATLDGDRAALEQGQRDSYAFYKGTKDQIAQAERALVGLNIQLPDFGGILGGPKEPSPEEVRKADEKRKEEMAKLPMFKALKEMSDPAQDKAVQDALKLITVDEVAALVMSGNGTMTPGEMRVRISALQVQVVAAERDAGGAQSVLEASRQSAERMVVGVPGKDNPVTQRIAELARVRKDLTERTVEMEREELALQTPTMSPSQQIALQTYAGIKVDEATLGWTTKDQINATNWGHIHSTNTELHTWAEGEWASYRKKEALRNGNIGGLIFGTP